MDFRVSHPKRTHRLRVAVLMLLLGIVAVSCGGSKDDRDEIRSRKGEPDDVAFTEGPYYDIEVWSYYDDPEPGRTTYYEFHKSKNSCGGGSSWSLYISGTIGPALQSDLEQMSQNEVVASDAPEETAVTPPPDTP
ncbi:hypothetical protein ACFL4Y_03355 [Gemmatimonadota bacterium]